ncbi:MAG TPA: DUF2235 domain-containing protein [Planctomycetota bacterium]|nr:DUF2235 domain-containing protein [Planctomycetota bacterium]
MDSTLDRRADAPAPAATPEEWVDAPPPPTRRADDSLARMDAAVRRHNERAPQADGDAPAADGNPLRAWDSLRPKHDDIGAWRAQGGEWRWEDAKTRQAPPPQWSKPDFAAPGDGYRLALDSTIEIALHQRAPTDAPTIAPGVMAHVAAAISAGRLDATDDVRDLVPLMQRMTVDRELDVTKGQLALIQHGPPKVVEPYAKLVHGTKTYFQDGTANHADNPDDHGGTNIVAMTKLMQHAYETDARIPGPSYFGGVGNPVEIRTPIRRLTQQITGAGMGDIADRVEAAFRADLAGGQTEFAIFGFSRGAAGAMESTNRFQDVGVETGKGYTLRHVGLYDTVAAMGPGSDGTGDLRLQPPRGEGKPLRIWHAMAQDEAREKFAYTDVGVTGIDNVIKDVFQGAHSDQGGGYANKGHSNIVLDRAVEEARRSGVPMPTVEEVVALYPEKRAEFLKFLHQDHTAPRHQQTQSYYVQRSRDMPDDVQASEFAQMVLRKRVEQHPVRNDNHEFDRRSAPFNIVRETIVEHLDPDGRYVFSPHDTPTGEAPPRLPKHSRREDPTEHRGIPLDVVLEEGNLRVASPGEPNLSGRNDEFDRRR